MLSMLSMVKKNQMKIINQGVQGEPGRKEMGLIPFKELSSRVIGCAIEVHRTLGPGLLESTYEQCLAHELALSDISFKLQYLLPVEYKGLQLDCGYRVDLLIEDKIILELKAVDEIHGIHKAQLLTYMKLAHIKQGYLINFNVKRLMDGLQSFVL